MSSTALPDELCALGYAIDSLKLANNEIALLPDDLDRLKKLRVLDMTGNQLEYMPTSVNALPCIEEILVGGNKLKSMKFAVTLKVCAS